MDIADVDRMLYRRLKPGNEYNNLIPKYQQVRHKFDKPSDNSDTFDTLKFMAQWSKKYSGQMARVAPLLKGKTLEETCNNIYNFLYWHFQYKLDGEAQNLYSPSAAWHFRQKGFDCKSYSLLASTILSNLKIDCAFRMVQQSQPTWSHVYVIVPDGNKYHVIDATTHNNKEVNYTKKHDKYMYHQGLASPIPAQRLGCSCNGQSVNKTGLGNPYTLSNSIRNFHSFLNQLERKGVSRRVTDNMLQIVKANVQAGRDPIMSEVYQKAVAMTPGGLGFDIGTTGTAITGAVNGEPESIKYLVSQIIPVSFIGSTFGAVFANGFDLSCWGASLTPAKAADNLKKNHTPHFNYRLTTIGNATNNNDLQGAINLFIKDVYVLEKYYREYKPKSASWSACAKKGIKSYQDFMGALKMKADLMITDFQSKGATVGTERLMPIDFWFRKSITGNADIDEIRNEAATAFVEFPQLNLANVRVEGIPTQANVIDNGNGTITTVNPITGETVTTPKPNGNGNGEEEKKSSPLIPLAIAGVVAKLVFFS